MGPILVVKMSGATIRLAATCAFARAVFPVFLALVHRHLHELRESYVFFLSLDINECSTGDVTCGSHEHCNNTVGGYSCVCDTGYSGSPCIGIHNLCPYS